MYAQKYKTNQLHEIISKQNNLAVTTIREMWLHTNVNDVRWPMKVRTNTMTTERRYHLITIAFSSLSAIKIVTATVSGVLAVQLQQKRQSVKQ